MSQTPNSWWRLAASAVSAASGIIGAVLAGALLGVFLDERFPRFSPWVLVGGLIVGLVLGVWFALRAAKKS